MNDKFCLVQVTASVSKEAAVAYKDMALLVAIGVSVSGGIVQ